MNRREFVKTLALGVGTAASPGILFPKPVEARESELIISEAEIENLFNDLVMSIAAIVRNPQAAGYINQLVAGVNQKLVANGYDQGRTPYAQRVSHANAAPIWGCSARDTVGPNPCMATAQLVNDRLSSAVFSAPTLVGINKSAKYLSGQGFSPAEIDGSLIPTRSRFEDWTTWLGDQGETIGLNPGVGLTQYDTKFGQVIRRYDSIDPYGKHIGRVRMTIEAANQPRRVVTTNIVSA